jgi:hypothetical protein
VVQTFRSHIRHLNVTINVYTYTFTCEKSVDLATRLGLSLDRETTRIHGDRMSDNFQSAGITTKLYSFGVQDVRTFWKRLRGGRDPKPTTVYIYTQRRIWGGGSPGLDPPSEVPKKVPKSFMYRER